MGTVAERLQEVLDQRGWDQADLARKVGATQGSISKIIAGKTVNSRLIPRIAAVSGVTLEWLLGEEDERPLKPEANAIATRASNDDPDTVEVEMIDLAYGMGGSFLDSDAIETESVKFSRSWLRKFTQSPPHLLVSSQGMGDSMMPTILDRDIVIIDRSNTRLEGEMGDKIWAIVFAGMGMIKRLRQMPDGTVKIMSDNQLVRDEIASDGELFIVGRVVAKVSTL